MPSSDVRILLARLLAPILKYFGESCSLPRIFSTIVRYKIASSEVEIPPAGLKPLLAPVFSMNALRHLHMVKAAIGVALGSCLPVEVLMKSAPHSRARNEAAAIASMPS